MIDRHLVGDIGLAILLALPSAAFVRPEPIVSKHAATTTVMEKAAVADQSAVERRVTLPG